MGLEKPHNLMWSRPIGSHQIGYHDQRGKEKNKPTLSKREANATPQSFAIELIKLARRAPREVGQKENIEGVQTQLTTAQGMPCR